MNAVRGAPGVVEQYAHQAPWAGGYRLIPRFKADVSDAPLFLPVTGGGLLPALALHRVATPQG